jgi:transcriptional regulator with XRE-family HTH domain
MTIEEIKQSQIDNKISDKELCAMANISVATFWRYKTGKTEMSVSKLKRLENSISQILSERAK